MDSIARKSGDTQRVHSIDEFLLILHPMERFTRIIYFDFHRINKRFEFKSTICFIIALVIILPDTLGNIIKIALEIKSSNLQQAQQVCAVFSVELLCLVRLFTLIAKFKKIEYLANALDAIYPRSYQLQQRFNVPKLAAGLHKRFHYLYLYVTFAVICFISIPCSKFIMFHEDPLPEDYHQHLSWMPFGIKQQAKYYPYIYAYETFITFLGVNSLVTWDRFFVVAVSILGMQFDFLNNEIKSINCEDSLDQTKVYKLNCHIKNCLEYQQLLHRLTADINDIFSISILISDMVCASSICLHLYLVVNTDDLMSFLMFLFPIFVLIFVTYDISKHGTQLITKSSRIKLSLYNQNWYNGSQQYRKLLVLWLQYANIPGKISALHLFEVSMLHFKKMATLTYQLFTFIQSQKYENK